MARRPSRRQAPLLIGGLLAAPWLGIDATNAGKKKGRKKSKKHSLCFKGKTVQAAGKKKKTLLKRGATSGACPDGKPTSACTPACAGQPCGVDDGCGGLCGCAAGSVCHNGVCQSCTVTCDGNGATCGAALQAALNAGGTVFACPGRYVGNFELNAVTVALIGAGQGGDPATDTILDASQTGRVLLVKQGVTAALERLRVTGGNVPSGFFGGGGIRNEGTLALKDCTVSQNEGVYGAGIDHSSTSGLTLTNCAISGNTSPRNGGGIFTNSGPVTIDGGAIQGNQAKFGGGIANFGSPAEIRDCAISGNQATSAGGGIFLANNATLSLNGATVTGNGPDNCSPVGTVAGCSG